VINAVMDAYIPPQSLHEMWDITGLEQRLRADFMLELPIQQWLDDDNKLYEEQIRERIMTQAKEAYTAKEDAVGAQVIRQFEKAVMLQTLDGLWKEHLAAMDHLRQGIHLRGYAQKNPKQEYKRESFELFTEMLENLKSDVVGVISKVQVQAPEDIEAVEAQRRRGESLPQNMSHATAENQLADESTADDAETFVRQGQKVGRNDPCPCGSGAKFKQCHGKLS